MDRKSAFWQIIFVGFAAFCCPGMFNAMQGLGGAGNKNVDAANTANAVLYAVFAISGYFGGFFFNILGIKPLMLIGGLTYAAYSCCVYVGARVENYGFMSILGGAILGVGAGWFWTAQGAMMMSYPTASTKGKAIGLFWLIFNLGGVMGGLLSFLININNEGTSGSEANPASYFVFVGLMILGAVSTLFTLVSPNEVVREDGEKVVVNPAAHPVDEIKGAFKVILDKRMMFLTVLFLSSNWFYTYQFNYVNALIFNVRTRGFNSMIYWGSQMISAVAIGKLLDLKIANKTKAKYGLLMVTSLFAIAYGIGIPLQYSYEGGYDKDNLPINSVDVKESSRMIWPVLTFLFYGLGDAALQAYAYWVMGKLAGADTNLCAQFAGYYKGIQSAGAAVAWGLDVPKGSDRVLYATQLWVCVSLWLLSTPLTFLTIKHIKEDEASPPFKIEAVDIARAETNGSD